MSKCHFCEEAAGWQVMSSHHTSQKVLLDGKWTYRVHDRDTVAQVCEEHLTERLYDNSAYHLVYRLGDGLGPDSFDWAILIEEAHRANLRIYEVGTFLNGQ